MTDCDYLVVGGGASGAVVAARLSEDPDVLVILLEAGPMDDDPVLQMPLGFSTVLKGQYDWDYHSEMEPGLDRRRVHLPAGRVLGGSSSINAMIYLRGNRDDYDGWAKSGLAGWDYGSVLPYFKRSEDNDTFENAYHQRGGPLGVSSSRSLNSNVDVMMEAACSVGLPATDDHNGESQEGVGRYQSTTRDGQRSSTSQAFLAPNRSRSNLTIITSAEVLDLEFEGNRAVGVTYERHGETHSVHAGQEVILSAGAYRTPQLLMLAGIGPAAHLESFGIPVRVDLPVGENLQDHPQAPITMFVQGNTLETAFSPTNQSQYERERRGPLTSNVGEAGIFTSTTSGLSAPDVQITMAPVMVYDDMLGPAVGSAVTLMAVVAKPASVGTLKLRTASPRTKPRITHNFLTDPYDVQVMVSGLRLAVEIANAAPMKQIVTGTHLAPRDDSDQALADYARYATGTAYHPAGTCSMGSVVDAECRVMGIEGLRVVDASIMPSVPRANTNAASIMIGEKGADLIRGRSSADH